MAEKAWHRELEDTIELPDGRTLATLREAATFVQGLPKAEHDLPHWQTAVEHLIYAAEREPAWTLLAWMAMKQALNHGQPKEERKKPVKAYRIRR
ncbi:hypothetical protein H8A99_07185 [Bradyrhizobium sp. Arg68]|uniref:hypothetical protein n=1 Tax=Bradyrhizobium ivorense TaxID=2511166 RepID=UPI001E42EDD1|nr:hypothetical protein [Bradyrhizobium ivorense]MCC8936284.1 hypothetical protein [Bradyrhizobium ivorense]